MGSAREAAHKADLSNQVRDGDTLVQHMTVRVSRLAFRVQFLDVGRIDQRL